MIRKLLIGLTLIISWSCEDPEELITNDFIGTYHSVDLNIIYEGLDLLDKTPLAEDYLDHSFSLFDDFTFQVDTSFIDYYFFLRPGVAFTQGHYIGVWSLLDRDEAVPLGSEFISLNLDRYYFIITRTGGNSIRFSSTSNSPLISSNDQVNLFRKIGADYGMLTYQAFIAGQSAEEAILLGERIGYYTGYHKRYQEISALISDVADDPIDVYAQYFIAEIDTSQNPNVDFMKTFRSAIPTGILLGTEEADQLFTVAPKSLDFDFDFARIE